MLAQDTHALALRLLKHITETRHEWESLSYNDRFWRLVGRDAPDDRLEAKRLVPQAIREALSKYDYDSTHGCDSSLDRNLDSLTEVLGLNAVERDILRFAMLVTYDPVLCVLDDADDELTARDVHNILSFATGHSTRDIMKALTADSALVECGIINTEMLSGKHKNRLSTKLEIEDGLEYLFDDYDDPIKSIINRMIEPSPTPGLSIDDYDHLGDDVRICQALIGHAMQTRVSGMSLFLYGPPGTGKTEFARALIHTLGGQAYLVPDAFAKDEAASGSVRGGHFSRAQRILRRRADAVMIFDEVEDVLSRFGQYQYRYGASKSWLTRAIEFAPVPTIWIANDTFGVDDAMLRRFDYAIRFDAPPRSKREQIIAKHFTGLTVGKEWIGQRSLESRMPPSAFANAADVARVTGGEDPEGVAERVLDATRELLELPEPERDPTLGVVYDLSFVNTDADLEKIAAELSRCGEGRVCLYGPPGTGKSAFAAWVARTANRTLLLKRGSDLISPFVGMTERNIAAMFREAKREDAVLLLDEADGFLRDRNTARARWEVTETNELLTRMEAFEGIFICTTNLFDQLDAAALRRFDLKARCDWLTAEQSIALTERHLQALGLDWPLDLLSRVGLETRLGAIGNLAPGDFAAVLRGSRLTGELTRAEALVKLLEAECATKPGAQKKAVGFVH